MTRRYYEIGQLVEVPKAVLVRHDGVIGLPVDWVLQTAAEIENAAAMPAEVETDVDDEENTNTGGTGWEISGPDTLTYNGRTIKAIGQERKLLLHLMEGDSPIETVSAAVWDSSEYETDIIKAAAKRINRKLEAAGIAPRVSVISGSVCLR